MWQNLYIVLMVLGIGYYTVRFHARWQGDEELRATLLTVNMDTSLDLFFVLIPASIFPVLGTLFLSTGYEFLMSLSFNLALAYWLVFLLGINRVVRSK